MTVSIPWSAVYKLGAWAFTRAGNIWLRFRGLSFVFEKYTKKITIYKNGHGIIVNTFAVKVLDDEQFTSFERKLSIHDSCKDIHFPKLEDMLKEHKDNRFTHMGFWYYDDGGYVKRVAPVVDDCGRSMTWKFCVNKERIKKHGDRFTLSYAISVPGLFPIKDGYLNKDAIADHEQLVDGFTSAIKVSHKLRHFRYVIAFEKGIEFSQEPSFDMLPHGEDNRASVRLSCENKSDIFYTRYVANTKSPAMGAKIKANWKLSEKPV